ncbi:MAG TPA: phosphoenolpyruvate-utilizing N-terminal domain-containing protein, partial [Erysipelotrichaceae bacterium]|nr:phosphoenolpyruvate-utilizing N-terminal domain-containing protein [Erysipelotrichaceae bacterium]
MLKGIAASSGITIAKAYKLETPEIVIECKQSNPAEEIEKFNKALEQSKKDIETIKEKATGRLSEDDLKIFDAHLMVCDDPALCDGVIDKINSESVNADYALDAVAGMFISMFESLEDAYMRERAAD